MAFGLEIRRRNDGQRHLTSELDLFFDGRILVLGIIVEGGIDKQLL